MFEGRWGDSRIERLPALMGELLALNVDLIVTIGGAAAMAAKLATPTTPIVAVLYNTGDHAMALRYREVERAAKVLRLSVEPLGIRVPEDFENALETMNRVRPDAVMLLTDALTGLNLKRFVDYAAQHRIPGIYEFDFVTRAGGLMSYGSDLHDNFKIAAGHISKIIKGAKPSELPVEQPNRYYLVINSITAKTLGLTIPKPLQLRAEEVIR